MSLVPTYAAMFAHQRAHHLLQAAKAIRKATYRLEELTGLYQQRAVLMHELRGCERIIAGLGNVRQSNADAMIGTFKRQTSAYIELLDVEKKIGIELTTPDEAGLFRALVK